ncbi:MAG TPA: hypothetical protein P5514_15605 [Bacteroidales bacterium]|nr:hypothetical protein [Bacteroidales bacterium]HRX98371.1 hypothetical protein [Bacteroidales bacterium]
MATDDNKNAEQTSTFKDFVDKAIAHLSNLTRLEVNTLVGEYEFNKVKNIPTTIKQDSTNERMCTQINLITGDITTAMTQKFATDYKDLREYHQIRENQGHKIIDQNIKTLKEIVNVLIDFSHKKESLDKNQIPKPSNNP